MLLVRGWVVTENRFLRDEEVELLRTAARARAEEFGWARRSAVLEWMVLELALFTGLRVSELAALRCGDLALKDAGGSLVVWNGKGGKSRVVRFGAVLVGELVRYLAWKGSTNEPSDAAAPLLLSSQSRGHLSSRALQKMFARVAKRAGVHGHRFHDLRHTHASHLYRASGHNLRLVQKQLGHASIRTTQVYADVFDEDLDEAVNKLYM